MQLGDKDYRQFKHFMQKWDEGVSLRKENSIVVVALWSRV